MRKLSVVVGSAFLFTTACQSLVEDLPDTGPYASQGVISTGPVAVAPTATPSPTDTPEAGTPVPPDPTDPPSPPQGGPHGPPPWETSCALPPGTGDGLNCGRGSQGPQFADVVDKAITKLVKQHPEIFDLKRKQGEGEFFVKDWDAYYWGVMQNVGAAGYCANFDGENIGVKSSNGFNEGYHILISNGFVWRPPQSWIGNCSPAWF